MEFSLFFLFVFVHDQVRVSFIGCLILMSLAQSDRWVVRGLWRNDLLRRFLPLSGRECRWSRQRVTVEEVLLTVGEQVGHESLLFASWMNKPVVVFLKAKQLIYQLIESKFYWGLVGDLGFQVSPLADPSMWITVSGVLPKFASGFKNVSLGCKDPKLRRAVSEVAGVHVPRLYCTNTGQILHGVRHTLEI